MVPIPGASYFPDVGKCLKGEEILISWETAFFALADACENGIQSNIEKFFSDPKVLDLLSQPCDAFPKPTADTKDAFEQKFRPINADNSSTEIQTAKDDALWLSKEADLDEVSALRVVIEEYQSRAYAQLLGPFSEEEIISLNDAIGDTKSTYVAPKGTDTQAESTQSESESQGIRHIPSWYELLPVDLVERWNGLNSFEVRLIQYIKAIRIKFEKLFQGGGSGWFTADGGREALELEWGNNQILEATHMMEIIFDHILSSSAPDICQTGPLLEWFRLLGDFGFLNDLEMPHPALQAFVLPMQTLSTVISSAILTTDNCLVSLNETIEMTAAGFGKKPETPWLLNEDAIRKLHEILMAAAPSAYITAGPALLAWSVILKQIGWRVGNRREAQNRRDDGLDDNTEQGSAGAPGAGALILAPDAYEGLLEDIMDSTEEDPIDFLALTAVNECRVFETLENICQKLGDTLAAYFMPELGLRLRMSILELMRASAPDIGYRTETFEVVVSAANAGQGYWDLTDARGAREANNPVKLLLSDPVLFSTFWQNAKYRYPFESAPFLSFCHALASLCAVEGGEVKFFHDLLEPFRTCTVPLPFKYEHYVTTQEEDNNNTIRLTRPLPLFEPRLRGANANLPTEGQEMVVAAANGDLTIRKGCTGRMVVENEPKVVYFFHNFNGVRYFGKLLETFLVAGDALDATTGSEADPEAVAQIVGTFAIILRTVANSGLPAADIKATANRFFETASSALGRNRDITLVISEVFEQELQRQSNETTSDASLDILTSCIQYLHALLHFSPGRVWPLIGRSGLLGFDRGAGKLSSIVGNVEVILGKYPFLIACTRLFEALVNDFTVNAIARKRKTNTVRRRFSDVEEHNVRVPDQVLSKVLLSFTRYLTEVLESSTTWRFVDQDERVQLTKSIMLSFDRMLVFAFGIQGVQEPGSKPLSERGDIEQDPDSGDDTKTSTKSVVQVNAALTPAATYIVESFLSKSSGPLRFKPILRSLYDGFNTPTSTIYLSRQRLVAGDVKAALEFSKRLLRVGVMLERNSHLEAQLFSAAPLIARLYAVNDSYRNPVIKLFEVLIISASGSVSEPPSLLGYLGAKTSKNFLHAVSHLDKPLSRSQNIGAIWHFLSMVMSSRQQWFANYVLTGTTPRDALKNKKPAGTRNTSSPKPLLNTAIDNLSHIGDIPDTEALVMLEFVALAQNFWPWTMHDLESNTSFITYLSRYIESLGPNQTTSSRNPPIKACHRTRIAAYIAEILAMHVFHSRQTGKPSIVKELMPKLAYYVNSATTAPSYNASLHGNLRQNFDSRYAACTLQSFRKTNLVDRQYGDNYFYDLELLDRMLYADEAWMGRRNNGYKFELASANVNMSLVDAQVALLQGWKLLAVELSANIDKDAAHQELLVTAALRCLHSNTSSQRSEEMFTQLLQVRADFALVVCQRLMEVNPKIPKMKQLLKEVWETIHSLGSSFEIALASGDASYYRLLLKLLFLGLRVHSDGNTFEQADQRPSKRMEESTTTVRLVVDILERVVAQGFRDLAGIVHENLEQSSPEDIALITGILQACLRVPGIEFCHPQIVTMMANCGTPRTATTLFSWADRLAINGDPIFGELAIIFLLELSSMSAMAEQLAIDGILGHLSSAAIINFLRRANVSPFADSAGVQRCYNIWVRGILPLLLNLLHSVGASIATEVALFLNQFPHLLSQSAGAFDAPEHSRTTLPGQMKHISLAVCSEVHSLALIVYILNGFREQLQGIQDVPDVAWDLGAVGENVEFWLGSRVVLRERIVPMGERDVEWKGRKLDPKAEGKELGCVDRLEEKCVLEMMGVRDVVSGGDP
ncbi:hypothetical protein CJF30_00003662 [Rutstroemia sp. NJR-2017a BBW]|nr:hypothetical protein CJF30_00003662 [Rutstroemia sp. NJR-2017a BBW]